MAKKRRLKIHVRGPARRDIAAILKRSAQEFGIDASLRYEALIRQALLDIETDHERPGSKERPELMVEGARTSPALMRRAHGDAVEHINRVRAESHLEGPQIRDVIERHGWKTFERRLFIEEGPKLALERILKLIQAIGPSPEPPANDGSGVWLYQPEC